jgi:3-hydroxybutyryl-CoA dehydrogenase
MKTMPVLSSERVAIIGFGLMGAQISQVFAQSGYAVTAYDVDREQISRGLELIRSGRYGLESFVSRGRMTQSRAREILSRITSAQSVEDAARGSDLLIEAAIEDLKIKRDIMLTAARVSDSILATNTSTLSVSKIGQEFSSDIRGRILGMHFFNPPQIMKLVEIIRTKETLDSVVKQTQEIAKRLGKTAVLVSDIPGFVANRIGISVFTEASSLLELGVATVRDIDIAMRLGYGYPMGPFELGDLVGLDTRLRNLEALYDETHEEKFKPPEMLRKLVREGYLGDPKAKKGSKGGYYEYFRLERPSEEAKRKQS